jgi:uncharacterized protein YigA (DUF484 family)
MDDMHSETLEADGATVRVLQDARDNKAAIEIKREHFGEVRVWLLPEQTAELMRALKRAYARQVVGGDGVPVGVDNEGV